MNLKEKMEALGTTVPEVINNLFATGARFSKLSFADYGEGCIMQRWIKNIGGNTHDGVHAQINSVMPKNRLVLRQVIRLNDNQLHLMLTEQA